MPKPFNPRDAFAIKAQKEGYLARSAYKLKEIDQKFHIFSPGDKVLDIGAAPGSWLQVASEAVGPKGRVLGIDTAPIALKANNITTTRADIFSQEADKAIAEHGPYNVVLSDAAPSTSGIKDKDQALSAELAQCAFEISIAHLAPGGALVAKMFQSPETNNMARAASQCFKSARLYKPKASRERSFELYIVCLDKKSSCV